MWLGNTARLIIHDVIGDTTMADVYSECVGGSLKLKGGVHDGGVKKLVSLWGYNVMNYHLLSD